MAAEPNQDPDLNRDGIVIGILRSWYHATAVMDALTGQIGHALDNLSPAAMKRAAERLLDLSIAQTYFWCNRTRWIMIEGVGFR
ncbi:hypothetical protein [Prosthecodimorpha staleyi]|uniref:Uncharacterized protein n=1 Tax=Prosthecodimorpha staleyi TaxID=2840188 RepID=A0A947D9J7_9HYPH|nr:hypothetical protein [Prosthecodimorpha staleyi]MBT9289394.1 hypothetical protein [Prosthecodimorpha staleyi]